MGRKLEPTRLYNLRGISGRLGLQRTDHNERGFWITSDTKSLYSSREPSLTFRSELAFARDIPISYCKGSDKGKGNRKGVEKGTCW